MRTQLLGIRCSLQSHSLCITSDMEYPNASPFPIKKGQATCYHWKMVYNIAHNGWRKTSILATVSPPTTPKSIKKRENYILGSKIKVRKFTKGSVFNVHIMHGLTHP